MKRIALFLLLVAQAAAADKLSPFTEVAFEGDVPNVRYEDVLYELVELEGAKAADIVAFCKTTYAEKWEKRFAEDLVEVLERMGKAPGATVKLVLKDANGRTVHVARAPMTKKNRKLVWQAREQAAVRMDLAQLEKFLSEHYSYLGRKRAMAREMFRGAEIPDSRAGFAVYLASGLARFGDGHTRVRGLERYLQRGYAPFLIGVEKDRLVAVKPNRAGFVNDAHPYLASLDGIEVAEWMEATGTIVAHGSAQFRRWNGAKALRLLGYLRAVLGRPQTDTVKVGLVSADGKRKTEVELAVAGRKPLYGAWPRKKTGKLAGGVGYLRIETMDDAPAFLQGLRRAMDSFRDTPGLIIDVRGNGGGSREALRVLLPYFLAPGAPSRVVNAARYRLPRAERPELAQGYLQNRFLYPLTWKRWTAEERAVIQQFDQAFQPEWTPPASKFSQWHFMLVGPSPDAYHYAKPVIVLLDAFCFSATDIFLGGLKGLANVTLMGVPSGGGSGRSRSIRLDRTGVEVRVSSMASFQPNGKLYDGNGVTPDVRVDPKASDWTRRTDTVLDAALARLRNG